MAESTETACQKFCTGGADYRYPPVARLSVLGSAHSKRAPRKFVWCNSFVWKSLRKLLQVLPAKRTPTSFSNLRLPHQNLFPYFPPLPSTKVSHHHGMDRLFPVTLHALTGIKTLHLIPMLLAQPRCDFSPGRARPKTYQA